MKKRSKAWFAYLLLFLIGAVAYPLLETIWRGYSHITMAFAGGICLCGIHYIGRRFEDRGLFLRALLCATFITAVELVFGCVFNLMLGMSVWDYSARPLNLLGQICIEFSLLWFILCSAVLSLSDLWKRRRRGVSRSGKDRFGS